MQWATSKLFYLSLSCIILLLHVVHVKELLASDNYLEMPFHNQLDKKAFSRIVIGWLSLLRTLSLSRCQKMNITIII